MGRKFFSRIKNGKSPASESTTSASTPGSLSPSMAPSSSFVRRVQDSDDLRQVFEKYDANSDGKISLAELDSMLQCLAGGAAAAGGGREEAEAMMKAADLDGDGFISLEEFMSVNKSETDSKKCLEDLRNAFRIFDQDKNGLISAEELHHVLGSIGEKTSLAECKSMIKGVDRNGDGAVNFEEFMQMMSRSGKPFA